MKMKLRGKILLPVIIILITAVTTISLINYFIARRIVTEMIDTEMNAAISNIIAAEHLSNEITNIVISELNTKNISLARALAEIIRLDPDALKTEEMARLASLLNVSEVHVADRHGILLYGNVPGFYGFDFASGDQSRPFLEIIENPALEIAQEAQPNVAIGAMFSYTGVARADERGFVQVGISAEILDELTSSFDIQKTVAGTRLGMNGYLFIVKDGVITSHFNESMIGEDFTPTRQELAGSNRTWLNIDGTEYYAGFYNITDSATVYAVVTRQEFFSHINMMGTFSVSVSVAAIGLMVIILMAISWRITRPINKLVTASQEIARGNLTYSIDIHTGDEIEDLGLSINKMAVDLKEYIANLQTATAEKERIGAELDVATKIQSSMLPCIFPAFPERAEFDIYASMQPAKEVGGDFYDFFLIGENTLAVVIADVSGKGVPAALFMVIAKTLLKNNAQYGKSPKEVFEIVNNMLCENNEAGMFVTAFMGYLDIISGKFTYVNAGHNPPLIRRTGDVFEWLDTKPGFVLAGMEDMFYKQQEVMLNPGDELFLYTDGLTEAVNNENELFTDPRLLEVANDYLDLPLKEFTVSLKREIDKFADGAEQADDITMLALRITQ